MIQDRIFRTPIGNIRILSEDSVITSLEYGDFSPSSRKVSTDREDTPFWSEVRQQLEEYFASDRPGFNLPCKPDGTKFQKQVWQALNSIPAGEVLTYGELATQLNSHPRAIGMACRKNPIPLVIPCHRVVAANGVGGFAGQTQGPLVELKKWLLQHESPSAELINRTPYH